MIKSNEKRENGKSGLAFHERNLRSSILSLLCREGGMPRARLSEKLQTTPAMMSRCIQRLQVEGLVHTEGRSKGSGGRMCTNVALNPNAGILVGLEYNPLGITTVVVNFAGQLEKQNAFIVSEEACDGSPDKLLSEIFNAIRVTLNSAAQSRSLLGIAAVDPGVIDITTGMTVSSNALPKWVRVPLREKLGNTFGVPVYLSNTTSAILAAVDRHELSRHYSDLFYLECRAGVSCAIKSNGRQILGSHGMAGELTRCFSSDATKEESRLAYVEDTLGFSAIRRHLHEAGHPAFQAAMPRADMIQNILALASEGDPMVSGILAETWLQLGQMCGSLANMLDPEVIVLDPHFGQADKGSLRAFEQGLKQHMLVPHADQIRIIISKLKEPAAPLGAALTLLDDLAANYAVSS